MLISLRQGPSSPAQRLRKATPGTYSKNSQKHSSSIVLDQQRRSAKTQNPTSLHRLLCWCTLIKQGIRAEGTGKSFTEAVTRTLAPTLLLRQTINLPLRRQPPCRVALLPDEFVLVLDRSDPSALAPAAVADGAPCRRSGASPRAPLQEALPSLRRELLLAGGAAEPRQPAWAS